MATSSMLLPTPNGMTRLLMRSPVWLYRLGLGGLANNIHLMILVTRGRKSGLPRYTPVEYRQHGSKTYVLSGWGEHADWVQNAIVHPAVTIQQGGESISACAEVVTNEGEALRALRLFKGRVPSFYDAIIARMTGGEKVADRDLIDIARQVTIVKFEPQPMPSDLPPLQSDLGWMLPALSVGMLLTWGAIRIVRGTTTKR